MTDQNTDANELAVLRDEVAELRRIVARLSGDGHEPRESSSEALDDDSGTTTRRGLIKVVGAASAGVVAGSVFASKPAAAADPNDVVKEVVNATTTNTELKFSAPAPSGTNIFTANASGFTGSGDASYPGALAGWAGPTGPYNGVYAFVENSNASSRTGHAVVALAVGAARSHVLLAGSLPNPKLDTRANEVGEIRRAGEDVWLCTQSGTPGTWRKIAGTDTSTLSLLDAPERAYDSRPSEGGAGPVTALSSQTVDLQTAGVPDGFTGALVNLTIVSPAGAGFAVLYADGASQPDTSSINYVAGAVVGNNATTRVSAAGLARIYSHATTHYVVDVVGYYE